ncbi:MAG: heme peroxidase family protein, partial [Pseudomonadota bacterium]
PDLEKFQPTREDLEPLGTAMADISELPNPVDNPPDSAIPAGFTYFGQFVDHDISLTDGLPLDSGTTAPGSVDNVRTASLDLDSLYGKGPDDPEVTFYEDDGVHLKIGTADPVPPHAAPELPNDLPRVPVNGQVPMRADIGDHRNDENLAVAQTHLSLLKFHNKVVDDASQPSDFESARKVVRQHYQSIVWDDFVSRLVDPAIFQKVKNEGRKWYIPDGVDDPTDLCMPVEFSVAAYRLGHTMVRNTYEWNRVFSTGSPFLPKATLINLFQFSEVSGNLSPSSPNGDGFPRLPANWPVDWRRMHDLGAADPVHSHDQLNFARPLNTVLAAKLGDLEEFRSVPEVALRNLAVRNLLRGAQLGLATGQDIAAKIGATVLSQAELTSGPHGGIVSDKGFDTRTPLWFYVLKEAEVQQGGQRLGDVGSTIVAETFHGLIAHSEDSIFDEPGWTPSLKPGANSYTMADMLIYVDDINPLGENPTV